VKCVKFWPRAQGLGVLTKYCPGRRRRVNYNDRNIPQLNLIHGTKLLCPLSILLGRIFPDLPYIPNDWKPTGTLEAYKPSIVPLNLSEKNVEENIEKDEVGQSREGMFSRESSNTLNLIGEHVDGAVRLIQISSKCPVKTTSEKVISSSL
jgi:hypothetical protein